jgi:hypothetical protein
LNNLTFKPPSNPLKGKFIEGVMRIIKENVFEENQELLNNKSGYKGEL